MAKPRSLRVEYQGNLHIIVTTPYHTIAKLKAAVKDSFGITHPFTLTHDGADLMDKDQLIDLGLDMRHDIRVRGKSVDPSHPYPAPHPPPSPRKILHNLALAAPDNDTSAPVVFISYQWDHQPQVKLLKARLELAGFSSWVDVQQLCGGDRLHPLIDRGIRGARVFLCCINKRYGLSDNCRRELSLGTQLNKPVIPVLLEQVSWPPEQIGTLLSELLYIKMYHTSKTHTAAAHDDPPWPEEKFNELIYKLECILPDIS